MSAAASLQASRSAAHDWAYSPGWCTQTGARAYASSLQPDKPVREPLGRVLRDEAQTLSRCASIVRFRISDIIHCSDPAEHRLPTMPHYRATSHAALLRLPTTPPPQFRSRSHFMPPYYASLLKKFRFRSHFTNFNVIAATACAAADIQCSCRSRSVVTGTSASSTPPAHYTHTAQQVQARSNQVLPFVGAISTLY